MREIKFRAWDKFNEVMTYSENKRYLSTFFVDYEACIEGENEMILMQYTGLKANGKEIYEGDVIEINAKYSTSGDELHPEQRFIVTWRDIFYSSFDEIKGKIVDIKYDLLVIGNIYENPELLKGGE